MLGDINGATVTPNEFLINVLWGAVWFAWRAAIAYGAGRFYAQWYYRRLVRIRWREREARREKRRVQREAWERWEASARLGASWELSPKFPHPDKSQYEE